MAVASGWTIYEHPEFSAQLAILDASVRRLRARDPDGFAHSTDAKLLAAIRKLTREVIPADPGGPQFRQGSTLGKNRRHWFRAKFGNGRYRLFYQFSSKQKVIIYAWINDETTLRTRGAATDAYTVFRTMLDRGTPPDNWQELRRAAETGEARKKS